MPRKPLVAAAIAVIAFTVWAAGGSAAVTNTIITSGPTGTIATDSATFAFTSPEQGGFQCRLDSTDPGDWTGCTSPQTYSSLADGVHVFEVRALNKPLNPDPVPAVRTFAVDTHPDIEPPQTTIVSGPSGTIAADAASFDFESSEEGSFECRFDSVNPAGWVPCSSPQSYSSLADGSHNFEVRATDLAGNVDPTPAGAGFAVDTTSPETVISSAPSGTIETSSASFAFEASELGTFECRLDSNDPAAWSPCTSPQGYASLADGDHFFEVRAADALGHVDPTPAFAAFSVYTGPPKPVAGKTFDLEPVEGSIELQCPGETSSAPLTGFKQVPMGCLINTRHGVVDLTASKGSSGELQGAHFWGGVFVATQDEGDNQTVGLKLAGRRMCERRGAGKEPVARISRGGKHGRRLWGSGKGNYSTSGSYGSATVRGTTWLVVDRCDSSTLVKVAEGTVAVRDFVKDKSVTLTTGEQYLAKAAIPRLDPDALP
ncbi:MAG TPA: hypothetical protein VFJ76_09845 [Solirubrobacterales bacterium]|nr:hypothetical protein [Solirubrobacterales bacterium]